jgi:protein tyrosine/serine phosphatase
MPDHRYLKRSLLAVALLFALVVGLAIAIAGDRGLPVSEGILNFGKVNDKLYRGAEPHADGVKSLKRLGIGTVIDLRVEKEISTDEAAEARAGGISYTNIPLKGLGRPSDEQIEHILSIIEKSPLPVFVHCEHGCDRTGTVIACYRLKHDHWKLDAAMKEAGVYGMSNLERGMRRYIADYAATVEKQ